MEKARKCFGLQWAVMLAVSIQLAPSHAQMQPRDTNERGKTTSARVAEVKGDTVVVAESKGRRQTLQLATGRGLKPGLPSGWCEEDCRAIRIGEASYAVRGRAPLK